MGTRVKLYYQDDQEYYAVNESGNRTDIDMLPADKKNAQSPMELLLSALVACAAVDIVSMIRKRRKTFVSIEGMAEGERNEKPPRKFNALHVHYQISSPDLTEEEAERMVGLATTKYCSVAGTINESSKITHGFEIIR